MVTYFVSALDRNDSPACDYTMQVTSSQEAKDAFEAAWESCQEEVEAAEDYSLTDIVNKMVARGYVINVLSPEIAVSY